MSPSLRGRSLLAIEDFTAGELSAVLDLAAELKRARRARQEVKRLEGRNIALIFEKTSTRTRCSFEVAAYDQGAHVTYLDPQGSQLGHKESIRDTARVVGRLYDAILYRGYSQAAVEELDRYAGVPVYNGLTDEAHPMQMLADLMTMREHAARPLAGVSFAYLGDTRSNMGISLMLSGCIMGMDVRLAGPRELWPGEEAVEKANELAAASEARLTITEDAAVAVSGAEFVHTDVWVSLGEPEAVWADRIRLLRPYQVDGRLMAATGRAETRFMHCLPAFHDLGTTTARKIHEQFGLAAMEVTDEVFEGPASIVFDQAENRMHTTKALLVATLAG